MLVRPALYGEKELKLLKKPLSKISGIWKEQKKNISETWNKQ